MLSTYEWPRPRYGVGAICLYRKRGQLNGEVVTIMNYRHSAIGSGDSGWLYTRVEPQQARDLPAGVLERYLAPLGSSHPVRVAQEVVRQLCAESFYFDHSRECMGKPVEVRTPGGLVRVIINQIRGGFRAAAYCNEKLLAAASEMWISDAFEKLEDQLNSLKD